MIGPDADQAREIAAKVRDVMRGDDRVIDAHLNWGEKMPSLRLDVDQARARAFGLTPQDIAQTLRTLIDGATVTTIRAGDERIDVVARAIPSERAALDRVADLTIETRGGVAVPIGQVAKIVRSVEEPIIWRKDREIVVTALGDVVDGAQPPDVSKSLLPKLAGIRKSLPPGYRIETGGAIEESQKGIASIAVLFPIMILAMLTLLMMQMQSFSRLAIVFFTAPLGIVGASIALNLAAQAVRFVALLGLIALAGMDMRNTVILVDQIESDVRDRGLSRREAMVFATMRRRPGRAHRAGGDPRDDPAIRERVLGADGVYDHGRAVGRNVPDAVPAARDLRLLVPQVVGTGPAPARSESRPLLPISPPPRPSNSAQIPLPVLTGTRDRSASRRPG